MRERRSGNPMDYNDMCKDAEIFFGCGRVPDEDDVEFEDEFSQVERELEMEILRLEQEELDRRLDDLRERPKPQRRRKGPLGPFAPLPRDPRNPFYI